MRTLARLTPLLLALGAGLAQADAPAPAAMPDIDQQMQIVVAQASAAAKAAQAAQIDAEMQMHRLADDTLAFVNFDLGQERVVKGAPYCADAVHETVQPLADGNRIVRSQRSRLCRDGEGRTRQELDRHGHRVVYLRDPVAGESWVLDTERKSARRLGAMGHFEPSMVEQSAWREYGERMREWAAKLREQLRGQLGKEGVPPVPPVPPAPPAPPAPAAAPPEPVILSQSDNVTKDAQGRTYRDVRVKVLRMDGAPGLPPLPGMNPPELPLPPGVAIRAQTFAPRGAGAVSSLGSKDMEGVKVNGERTSWTIAAGAMGNEKPIVITRDVWTSPELMLTVASRDFDPRSGETSYRLQNLKRGEPDAALMKVPADFSRAERSVPKASAPAAKG